MYKKIVFSVGILVMLLTVSSYAQEQNLEEYRSKNIFLLLAVKSGAYRWQYAKELHGATWDDKIEDIEKARSQEKILLIPEVIFSVNPVFIRAFHYQSSNEFQSYGNGSINNTGIDLGVGAPVMGCSLFFGWRKMIVSFEDWATSQAENHTVSDIGMGMSLGIPVNPVKRCGFMINAQGFVGGRSPVLGLESDQPIVVETELNLGYKLRKPNLSLIAGYEYRQYGKTGTIYHLNYDEYVKIFNNKYKSYCFTAVYSF